MQLVAERIEDILKPKSKEEIKIAEEEWIKKIANWYKILDRKLDSLKTTKDISDSDKAITNVYYELPDHIRTIDIVNDYFKNLHKKLHLIALRESSVSDILKPKSHEEIKDAERAVIKKATKDFISCYKEIEVLKNREIKNREEFDKWVEEWQDVVVWVNSTYSFDIPSYLAKRFAHTHNNLNLKLVKLWKDKVSENKVISESKKSVSDILKPKSKEEIKDAEEIFTEKIKENLAIVEGNIIFLQEVAQEHKKGHISYDDRLQWGQTFRNTEQLLMEIDYEYPAYIRNKFNGTIENLYNKLYALPIDFMLSESLILEKNKLQLTAGFVIIQNNKILLTHPTNAPWKHSFSIPKGYIEGGEDFLDTAIRETREEIGIKIKRRDIVSGPHFLDYTSGDKLYKRVYYFVVKPSIPISKSDIGLQKSEVDWAWFVDFEEALKRILPRQRSILKYLRHK
jgi:ADP-ribose pyrophosphatase YjhB (NUDIX family)